MNAFTCDICNKTFIKKRSDEKAIQEYEAAPWHLPNDETGVVCDDCFKDFKSWFDSLTPEEHKRLLKEAK